MKNKKSNLFKGEPIVVEELAKTKDFSKKNFDKIGISYNREFLKSYFPKKNL